MKLAMDSPRARWMVADCARTLKRFYFLQRDLVVMQAGWLPGVAHLETKLGLAESLWQDALVASHLRERVLELRYPDSRVTPGDDAPLLEWWRHLGDAPTGEAFVAALTSEIKPALRSAFTRYLAMTDHLDDQPTVRILQQALGDIDSQRRRFPFPAQSTPEATAWSAGVAANVAALDPDWTHPPSFEPAHHGGKPFQIARRGLRDERFPYALFPWPDSLDPARGPGEGFELQVRQAQAHLNEIWACEMAAACLFDLTDRAPAEFLPEVARWCFDEARHCRMGLTRFQEWGFAPGEMPLGSFSYDAGADADPITRLGIIFYFESTYIHTKSERKAAFATYGDPVSSHDMDFDWADELIHAHYGKKWLNHFLKQNGDRRTAYDVKTEAERCIARIRAGATPADRARTEELYQQTMTIARRRAGV